jgi:5'(3')-deoxyribonucleotidase
MQMKKQIIAIDIDDVLADHVAAFVVFSNSQYGTNLGKHNYDDRWSTLWDVDRNEIERRALEFHTAESIMEYELIEEAQSALSALSKHYELSIVSARPRHVIDASQMWLEKHFGPIFKEVHFLPYWEEANKLSKADICNQIGAEFLIDDIVKHCNLAAECGIQSLLFGDYSWNQSGTIHDDVSRVKNWQEVLEYFDVKRSQ